MATVRASARSNSPHFVSQVRYTLSLATKPGAALQHFAAALDGVVADLALATPARLPAHDLCGRQYARLERPW